jgi:hypothetical protein
VLGVEKWAVFFMLLSVFLSSYLAAFVLNTNISSFCQLQTAAKKLNFLIRMELIHFQRATDWLQIRTVWVRWWITSMLSAIIQDVPPIDIRNKSKVKRGPSASQLVNWSPGPRSGGNGKGYCCSILNFDAAHCFAWVKTEESPRGQY